MIPGSADGDIVISGLGVELGDGQIAVDVHLDGAGLIVAVLAHAVGGTAGRIDLAVADPAALEKLLEKKILKPKLEKKMSPT